MATAAAASSELTQDELLRHYRVMRTIREFEERVHREFATGDIPGFVHMGMAMLEALVFVPMLVPLAEMQPQSERHQGTSHQKRRAGPFPVQHQPQRRSNK